jgi:hypothetical protein
MNTHQHTPKKLVPIQYQTREHAEWRHWYLAYHGVFLMPSSKTIELAFRGRSILHHLWVLDGGDRTVHEFRIDERLLGLGCVALAKGYPQLLPFTEDNRELAILRKLWQLEAIGEDDEQEAA